MTSGSAFQYLGLRLVRPVQPVVVRSTLPPEAKDAISTLLTVTPEELMLPESLTVSVSLPAPPSMTSPVLKAPVRVETMKSLVAALLILSVLPVRV